MRGWWAARDEAWAIARAFALLDRRQLEVARLLARRPWLVASVERSRARGHELDRASHRVTRRRWTFVVTFDDLVPRGQLRTLPSGASIAVSRLTGRAWFSGPTV